jgi:hypothetical protein
LSELLRRFPAPWHADKIPGGYVVRDATGQAIAWIYARETVAEAMQAKVLTKTDRDRKTWAPSLPNRSIRYIFSDPAVGRQGFDERELVPTADRMPAKSASLYASQVDALEHLAMSDLE